MCVAWPLSLCLFSLSLLQVPFSLLRARSCGLHPAATLAFGLRSCVSLSAAPSEACGLRSTPRRSRAECSHQSSLFHAMFCHWHVFISASRESGPQPGTWMLSKCLLHRCKIIGASDKPNTLVFFVRPGGFHVKKKPWGHTASVLEAGGSSWLTARKVE